MVAKTRKHRPAVAKTLTRARYAELNRMLIERRREILNEVRCKVRDVRAEGSERDREVHDPEETCDVEIHEDIAFALVQMKAETVKKINGALSRLKEGTYGHCFECGEEITELRLRALPFAVRCKDCEEAREVAQQRERIQARRGSSSLGFDLRGQS